MASLALGAAGAAVGGMIGGPVGASIGWSIGSMLGNLLDPPKVEGPRRTDLRLQHSTYGAAIPLYWGSGRGAGNVIWQPEEMTEHEVKSGGKGGPEVTNYTYSASCAILLCATRRFDTPAILGIRRIWADGRLVSDTGMPTDDLPFTLYLGTEDQDPDPTMEADPRYGVGEVPAYRGYAYIVFNDLMLTDYFDRIPSFEFEIEASGDLGVSRVSTWVPPATPVYPSFGYIPLPGAAYVNGVLHSYTYTNGDPSAYSDISYQLDGTVLETIDAEVINHTPGESNTWITSPNSSIAVGITLGVGGNDMQGWYVGGVHAGVTIGHPPGFGNPSTNNFACQSPPVYSHLGYVYGIGDPASGTYRHLARWTVTDGIPDDVGDAGWDMAGAGVGGGSIAVDEDGHVWLATDIGSDDAELREFDEDLTLINTWALGPDGLANVAPYGTFTVYRRTLLIPVGASDPDPEVSASLWRINDDNTTFTFIGEVAGDYPSNLNTYNYLGGGYVLTVDGVLRLSTIESLGVPVADISELCGLTSSQYDVSDLTDSLLGYRLASVMTGRNALEPLRAGYFFDGAEVDDYILFKHRNHASVATIDEADLAAHEYGSEAPPLLQVVRTPDHELPYRVVAMYTNPDTDYQPDSEYDERLVGSSTAEVTLDLPIVMSNDFAKSVASTHVFAALIERERFTLWTTRKWEKVVPTDVITTLGRDLRVVDKRSVANGIVEFDCLTARASLFDEIAAGGSTGAGTGGGFTPPTLPTRSGTELVLLDIPILSQSDAPFGFYAAMGPSGSGAWPGANLYKSADSGATWAVVASSSTPSVIGVASGALDDYTGGAVLDTASGPITIVLTDAGAELESCTSDALDAGANLCAIRSGSGWELLQFQNATLTAPKTYEIDQPYYRGRLESEGFNAGHAAGDTFVLLPVTNVDAPETDLGLPFTYKAVTFGNTLAGATPYTFTNNGAATGTYFGTELNNLAVFVGDDGAPPPTPKKGLVPAPATGDAALDYFLSADGTWKATPGGSGTPANAQYLTLATDATLTNERVATGSARITITDAGAGSTATFDLATTGVTAAVYGDSINIPQLTVNSRGQVTAASNIPLVGIIQTMDEGSLVDSNAIALNFVGSGVVATDAGAGVTTITIAGGGGVVVKDEGSTLTTDGTTLDFVGSGVTASGTGATKTITVPGVGSDLVFKTGGGIDGACVLDGTNTFAWATKTGNDYAMIANVYATDLTINSGCRIIQSSGLPNSYGIYCTGTLTNNGEINGDGNAAVTSTAGAAWTESGTLGGGNSGTNGKGAGINGNGNNLSAYLGPASFGASGGIGGVGGGAGANVGGTVGIVTPPTAANGSLGIIYDLFFAIHGRAAFGGSLGNVGGGQGGSGGAATGGAHAYSGAGGGGGRCIHIVAKIIAGSGSITAKGGPGSNGSLGDTGGGGGGGGGRIECVTTTANWQSLLTVSVAGGAAGNGTGTGTNGNAGAAGRIIEYIIGA